MSLSTWDINKKGTNTTLSNNNLTATNTSEFTSVLGTSGQSTGKRYFEIYIEQDDGRFSMVGIANINVPLNYTSYSSGHQRSYWAYTGNKYPGALAYASQYFARDTIGIAVDFTIGTLSFYLNGTFKGIAFTDILTLGTIYPFLGNGASTPNTATLKTTASQFKYPIPTGYLEWGGVSSATPPQAIGGF